MPHAGPMGLFGEDPACAFCGIVSGRVRASLLLWGGWLLVTGAVFSFMDGTVHPYYTVALAPAIAALVGISVAELLRRRDSWLPRLSLAVMLAVTGVWAFVLLNRTPDWLPALRWMVSEAARIGIRLSEGGKVVASDSPRITEISRSDLISDLMTGKSSPGLWSLADWIPRWEIDNSSRPPRPKLALGDTGRRWPTHLTRNGRILICTNDTGVSAEEQVT